MFIRLDRLRARLRAHFKNLRRICQESVPYVTRFTASGYSSHCAPQPKDYPGLLFIQYAEDQSGRVELDAYWKSREVAIDNASLFQKALGCGAPTFQGYIRSLQGREEQWWKQISPGRWILYAASLFGAFAVLQTYYAKLLERPDIAIDFPGPMVLNLLSPEELSFDVAITNRSREVYSIVTFSSPTIKRSDGTSLGQRTWSNLQPGPIAPSATHLSRLKGNSLPPGRYEIRLMLNATTGYFRKPKTFSAARQVKVWSREPETRISILPEDRQGASVKGQVFVGAAAPYGLICQVTIQNCPTVKFGFVQFPGVQVWQPRTAPTSGLEVRTIIFKSPESFTGLQSIDFEISLDSSKDVDWDYIRDNSSAHCDRAVEEAKL